MTSPAPDAPRAANRRGVLAMCGAMACLVANDTLVKFASQSLPASELIFVRGVFATALLLVLVRVMGLGAQLPALLDRRVLLRALLDGLGTLAYLTSLFHLPLANTNAINMAAPLFITVFAALLFQERVAAARWAAVGVGFTGVLLVVQPVGSAFNAFALLTASSLDALAARMHVPAAVLAAEWDEVERCKASGGPDRFGRAFGAAHAFAGPWHAVKVTGALFHTQGGLVVDTSARVRRRDGGVFPNLFAAGGAAAGVSGKTASGYLSGNGLLAATVLGRLAGQAAARALRP